MISHLKHVDDRQRGVAAVELAIILPVLLMLLIYPLYLGRVAMHYTVIQHAAQEAARYLSKAPVSEMNNPNRAITVAKVAEAIIKEELSELSPGAFPYVADMLCDGVPCVGYSKPVTVSVSIQLIVQDIFFPGYTALEIPLMVSVKYPYLGR